MSADERGHRKDDAPSDAAQRIEDKLIEETGQASGNPDKPVQDKFDELGEKPDIKKKSLRD
ncbi:hypothetical protein FBZ84_101510 [Azospirillum baldaniorum]|uniref:hypothetical protein n=1 Tax=Azospirillum baldaniorum TaxID=1064539 RepID=UPI0011AA6CFE|nr:hypothetical protein [Azospirillum baldaniorum]TWA72234.1 hypothetical protein FBZ84_101510 [Azospirillum baldaniorum]